MVSFPRVGLVLGAGGPVGHAYHSGLLHALHDVLGWHAADASLIVGTSAGAQVAALLRAGMAPADLAARARGATLGEQAAAIARHYTRPDHRRPEPGERKLSPASPSYLRRALGAPWRARPGRLISALLPEGHVSLQPQAAGLRRLFGDRWPRSKLWITAVELDSGSAVAFGSRHAPPTDVGTAVACSGAVPGICKPVQVGRRRYVDGGIASPTHLDMLDERLDLVVVSSPLSMFAPLRLLLRAEMRRLERRGTQVFAFEPRGLALTSMGQNPMDTRRARGVVGATYAEARRQLESPALGAIRDQLRSISSARR